MQWRKSRFYAHQSPYRERGDTLLPEARWLRRVVCSAVFCLLAALAAAAQNGQPSLVEKPALPAAPDPSTAANPRTIPAAVSTPVADATHKKQLADDTARLLQLANELKAEVDKSNKDMLSMTVIRKAEEIERLARAMREKSKAAGGAE